MTATTKIAAQISSERYLRERLNPEPGDGAYLHLADLLLALRARIPREAHCRVLDYGSGGMPYRSLFTSPNYCSADITAGENVRYVIHGDGTVPAPDESFDVVLSTQVLEHVPDPARYLDECVRLLAPGGLLLLSTHGSFEDHGCPHDFRRWTADGLIQELETAGLKVTSCEKTTTNGRAVAFLMRTKLSLLGRRRSLVGFCIWLIARALQRFSAAFDRWCDRNFADSRVVQASDARHTLYVAIVIGAVKARA